MKNHFTALLIVSALAVLFVVVWEKMPARADRLQPLEKADGVTVQVAGAQHEIAGDVPDFVTEIPAGYRDWKLVSVAREEGKLNDLRAILGNDIALQAYREGTLPFPDGAIIARLAWSCVPSAENNEVFGQHQSFVAGPPKNGVQSIFNKCYWRVDLLKISQVTEEGEDALTDALAGRIFDHSGAGHVLPLRSVEVKRFTPVGGGQEPLVAVSGQS
jgi:hypothetical protein